MKYLFAILATLAVSGFVFAGKSSEEAEEAMDALMGKLMNITEENAEETLYEVAVDGGKMICEGKDTIQVALNESMKRYKAVDWEGDTMCGLIKKHTLNIAEPIIKAVDGCVENDLKGVLELIVKSTVSTVDKICTMNGEHLIELVNPCVFNIDFEKCDDDLENLVDEVKKKEFTKIAKNLKEETCDDYKKSRPCIIKEIEAKCELQVTRESVIGLIDAAFKKPACTARR